MDISILITNKAIIKGLDTSERYLVKEYLTVDNPLIKKKLGLGLSVWNDLRQFNYYESANTQLTIPIGALQNVIQLLNESLGTKILKEKCH